LVKLGLAALDVGQEAVYALERGADARRDILGAGAAEPAAIKQLLYPLTGGASRGSSSELGQTVMALIQTGLQLVALRSAEMEAAARGLVARAGAPGTPSVADVTSQATARTGRGKVRIVSR
jgi:hypothetical protein